MYIGRPYILGYSISYSHNTIAEMNAIAEMNTIDTKVTHPLFNFFNGVFFLRKQVLGLQEGRSSSKWQDYSLDGHQIVCHLVNSDYRGQDYVNPVGTSLVIFYVNTTVVDQPACLGAGRCTRWFVSCVW